MNKVLSKKVELSKSDKIKIIIDLEYDINLNNFTNILNKYYYIIKSNYIKKVKNVNQVF